MGMQRCEPTEWVKHPAGSTDKGFAPVKAILASPSLSTRFAKSWIPEPNSGCWLWTGYCIRNGTKNARAVITGSDGSQFIAARISWFLHKGEDPSALYVCHHCDNPMCVNPDHLFLGSHIDNMQDSTNKGRRKKPRTHCPKGHELTPENTYWQKGGKWKWRICRTCTLARMRKS